jgi:hypothetical protein
MELLLRIKKTVFGNQTRNITGFARRHSVGQREMDAQIYLWNRSEFFYRLISATVLAITLVERTIPSLHVSRIPRSSER